MHNNMAPATSTWKKIQTFTWSVITTEHWKFFLCFPIKMLPFVTILGFTVFLHYFVLNFLFVHPRRISTFQTYRKEEHVVSCRFSIGFQVIELIKLAYVSIYSSVSINTVYIFSEMYLFEIQPQPKQSFAEVDHTSFFRWALHWQSSPTKLSALKTEA